MVRNKFEPLIVSTVEFQKLGIVFGLSFEYSLYW